MKYTHKKRRKKKKKKYILTAGVSLVTTRDFTPGGRNAGKITENTELNTPGKAEESNLTVTVEGVNAVKEQGHMLSEITFPCTEGKSITINYLPRKPSNIYPGETKLAQTNETFPQQQNSNCLLFSLVCASNKKSGLLSGCGKYDK